MSALAERAGAVAREILDQRDPYGTELRDNVLVSSMLADAYARGFVASLDHAASCVRVESEATKGELA